MISIVCVYNNKDILERYLLKSLRTQTVQYEFIGLNNEKGVYRSAAEALNEGGSRAKGKYIMFVHQDVELSSENWLAEAENILDKLENLGIAGVAGKADSRGVVTNITHGIPPRPAGTIMINSPYEVQTVDECLAIIPKAVFSTLKFDENTCDGWHLYTVDYSLSVRKLGLKAYCLPLPCYHVGGQTTIGKIPQDYYLTLKKICEKHKDYPVIHTTNGDWTPNPLNKKSNFYYESARKDVIDFIFRHNLPHERILEIGCAKGLTGRIIRKLGKTSEYIGIEISEEATSEAKKHIDKVIVGDIEKINLEDYGIKKDSIDLILCLDVLEHLYNPWKVLSDLQEYLRYGGYLVASIPNVQNISIINSLVNGRWSYEEAGLLDSTHIRFFTLHEIINMFSISGLSPEIVEYILNPPLDLNTLKDTDNIISLEKVILRGLSKAEVIKLFAYQYLVAGKKPSRK